MKALRNFSGLMILVICLSSFSLFNRCDPQEIDVYMLALRFQDASGNNLAEGIGNGELHANEGNIDSKLYSLEIYLQNYIDGETVSGPDAYPRISSLETIKHNELGTCLSSYFALDKDNNNVRKLIYKLRCPYIFGDSKMHEIVTYWEFCEIYAKCYRIEFEGQEITPQPFENSYFSLGIITLDNIPEK